MLENKLKIELFNYLLKKKVSWSFLASEVPFLGLSRFIDVCAGTLKSTYAYELKGDRDSLKRLKGQLKDMLSSFNYVLVLTTQKHLAEVERACNPKVGILLWDGKKVKEIRKATKNKEINSFSLLSGISKSHLISHYKQFIPNYNASAFEIRKALVKKIENEELWKLYRDVLISKYGRRTKVFIKEAGQNVTMDDLEILRSDFPTSLKIDE